MKVSELIEQLKKENQDAVVIRAKDEEGNGFEQVTDIENGVVDELNWNIEAVYLKELTPELEEAGFTEDDVREEGIEVVVIW